MQTVYDVFRKGREGRLDVRKQQTEDALPEAASAYAIGGKASDQTADQVAGAANLGRRQVCQQRGHIRCEPLDLPVPLFIWPKQV